MAAFCVPDLSRPEPSAPPSPSLPARRVGLRPLRGGALSPEALSPEALSREARLDEPEGLHFTTGGPRLTRLALRRGLLREPGLLGTLALPPGSTHFLITDHRVARLHGRRLHRRALEAGHRLVLVALPEGEGSKSLEGYGALARAVLRHGPDEQSTILALGGGLVCNLAGLLAATLHRGVRLIHLPSTLMAQCDAAISHKQAINAAGAKNLLGAYYAPERVLVDPELLETLPEWRIRDGFAEILKHALAEDAAFFERLLAPDADLGDLDFVGECIEHTIRLKCALIVADPSERDQGMVLHYGHTVGHAVEQATGYRLGHGHSVAIGMVAAAHLAAELGVAELGVLEAHHGLLARHGLPRAIPDDAPLSSLLAPLRASKRRVGDTLQMALVARVGELHRGSRGAALSIPLPRLVRSLEALAP